MRSSAEKIPRHHVSFSLFLLMQKDLAGPLLLHLSNQGVRSDCTVAFWSHFQTKLQANVKVRLSLDKMHFQVENTSPYCFKLYIVACNLALKLCLNESETNWEVPFSISLSLSLSISLSLSLSLSVLLLNTLFHHDSININDFEKNKILLRMTTRNSRQLQKGVISWIV